MKQKYTGKMRRTAPTSRNVPPMSQPANGTKRMEAAWRALADEQDWLDGKGRLTARAMADNVLTCPPQSYPPSRQRQSAKNNPVCEPVSFMAT
jgi:hypothetical protein